MYEYKRRIKNFSTFFLLLSVRGERGGGGVQKRLGRFGNFWGVGEKEEGGGATRQTSGNNIIFSLQKLSFCVCETIVFASLLYGHVCVCALCVSLYSLCECS